MAANENAQEMDDLSRKLDTVVAISKQAKIQGEAIQDLLKDLNLVSNSAVLSLQDELELENVHLDGRDVRELAVLVLKNLRNFKIALSQLEAVTELGQETAATVQKLVMDLSRQVEDLEKKGYFEHGQKALQAVDLFLQNLPRQTFENLETAAPELAKLTWEATDAREIAFVRRLIQNRRLLISSAVLAWLIPVALLVANLFL